jgi:hypothetical protein
MTRLAEAESLRRIENAARTTGDFQEVCEWYDKLDANRERRERYNEIRQGEYNLQYTGNKRNGYKLTYSEIGKKEEFPDNAQEDKSSETGQGEKSGKSKKKESSKNYYYSDGAIIPPPLMAEYWRELMSGDFISTIYDDAEKIWQVFGDWQVGRLIKALTVKQRDTLFRSAVRGCPSELIAECTGKTKRGVNKLLAAALKYIRSLLAERIRARLDAELPVTLEKRQFLEWYDEQKEGILKEFLQRRRDNPAAPHG